MKPFQVSPITQEIVVRFSNQEVQLPKEIQQKIDTYWDELIASGNPYRRGEVFTVTKTETNEEGVNILVEKTDYAHYLYCQNVDSLGEYGVQIIHPAALVETSDGYLIFGEMGSQTARAGIYQLCGGGLDNSCLKGEFFDVDSCISQELQEELDTDITDSVRVASFDKIYLKEGGPADRITVIYNVILNETKDEFLRKYEDFAKRLVENGEEPEFGRIIALKKEKRAIEDFLGQGIKLDEYMKCTFEQIIKELV